MSSSKIIRPVERGLLVILITGLLWTWFTWPLPRHVFSGIPWTGHATERNPVRTMVSGDHLQLLYHFWLLGDMLRGDTPWFNNLYEFNTGKDDASYRPDPFYVPVSLVYVAGERLAGRAFGWNLAGFISLLFTLHFTWRLGRRFTDSDRLALAAAVLALAVPYRWFSLLGGSPTGFGMTFVPMLFLGLDRAIRDNRVSGGLLAGFALIMAYCTDLHVFYFSILAVPAWCLLALFRKEDFRWMKPRGWWRMAGALWPVLLGVVAAYQMSVLAGAHLSGTDLGGGRSLREVATFSPRAGGFFGLGQPGPGHHIYLGIVLPLLLASLAAFLLYLRRGKPRITGREWTFLVMSLAGMAVILLLALGPNGPFGGALFRFCRSVFPKYTMIRQAPKIYCLLPSLVACFMALASGIVMERISRRKWFGGFLLVMVVIVVMEFQGRIRAGICELDTRQAAYRAVVADAARNHRIARALVLPIWPGNSHWASLYEHYASLHRLRMVNGYSPAVSTNYIASVFRPLESANLGELQPDQLDQLRDMGVDYILLHEDAFPEKVSPYPVVFTLNGLLSNPRLEWLAQDRQVWAFRIRTGSGQSQVSSRLLPSPVLFPARQWQAESSRERTGAAADIPMLGASGMAYVCLSDAGASLALRPTAVPAVPGQSLLVRIAGGGELRLDLLAREAPPRSAALEIRSESWNWRRIPFTPLDRHAWVTPRLTAIQPFLNVDMALLSGSPWRSPLTGQKVVLPAASFFHAGYSDLEDGCVTLSPDRDPEGAVFYGLNLPLEPGEYESELRFFTAAPDGTELGAISASGEGVSGTPAVFRAGGAARQRFTVESELPVRLNLEYHRQAVVRLASWTLHRIK